MFDWLKKLLGIKASTLEVTEAKVSKSEENILDCKNMNCPMPIIKISQRIKTMNVGDTITVIATDPAFQPDVEAWVRKTENELVSFNDKGHEKIAVIKKIK